MTIRRAVILIRRIVGSRRRLTTLLALVGTILWPVTEAAAQQPGPDLSKVTLQDLMNITITSASRKDQPIMETAAAAYVITEDDIRRSGLTSVPELLRLAPGVQVARIDANKFAIAIRGFNFRWSNKLLVLVDGRSVYNRLESGVHWDMVAVPVEDIDRRPISGSSAHGSTSADVSRRAPRSMASAC